MTPQDASPLSTPLRPSPPPHQRGLWAVPLLLSVLFVAGVMLWARSNDHDEREELHRTLIGDALSTEAQLRGRLDLEAAHLRTLVTQLHKTPRTAAALAANPEVEAGFRRLWISVTWLDANNRILAHLPEAQPKPLNREGGVEDGTGVSSHLVAPVRAEDGAAAAGTDPNGIDVAGEKVVVRYSPAALLKRGTPWWLSRKYDAQLVDGSDQVIASLDDTPLRTAAVGERDSYRVNVGAGMPGVFLELTQREQPRPWWRSMPAVLIAGFLALIGVATALLRRQMRQVLRAEAAWRTEVAWRSAMEDSALVALRARDAEGRLLYVNRTFCDMGGLPSEKLVGLAPPFPYWPPESIEQAHQRSQRNLAGLAPREGYEARWQHADGHVIDVMVFESPLVNAVGQQIGWMGSIIDITARKRLEERERRQTEAMAHQARLTTLGEVA
jgi:two-component system sensor histidine kinase DctS